MKIALHITDRTLFTWPAVYWQDLIKRLIDADHEVFIFSDESHVNINIKHERVHKCFGMSNDVINSTISKCDLFIGVPLKFSKLAKANGLKIINLLGSTLDGEGIKSPLMCAGCIDKTGNEIDCAFQDELCMHRITPIMVNREVDKLCRSIIE